MPPLLMVRA